MKKILGKISMAILCSCKNARSLDVSLTLLFYLFVAIGLEFFWSAVNNLHPRLDLATLQYFWMLFVHAFFTIHTWYEKIED